MSPSYSPLTEEHYQVVNNVIQATTEALRLAKDCHDCGLDTSEFIGQLESQRAVATKLKAKFWPDRT